MGDEAADVDLRDLYPEDEEQVPLIIAVHNGVVTDDGAMFVQSRYSVPISKLLYVQRYLSKYEVL